MISYFVRRYVKGVKGSGTKDLIKMDEAPQDFASLVEPFGPGKYILFNRQKGVRGFSKMIEHIVAEPIKAFAAESVSVKQNVDVGQVPTDQLKTLLSDMISKPQGSEDFAADMQKVYNEILSRADSVEPLAASSATPVGLINKHSALGFAIGAVGAGAVVNSIKNKEIEELKLMLEQNAETVTKLAETVKLAEHERKKAESAESAKQKMMRQKMGMDSEFLSEFNRANGWR
tara:strand:- start:3140 stop:3832 length:693 start_codon:yes stop_codon:yes gene_type:complete